MINCVALMGRLTKDPTVNYAAGGTTITKFTVAVDRRFKTEGQPDADFINCVAFKSRAEFVEKWFHRGDPIALTGSIQTGKYTNKDGATVYTTDVIVDQVSFVPKTREQAPAAEQAPTVDAGFMDVPEADVAGLPF